MARNSDLPLPEHAVAATYLAGVLTIFAIAAAFWLLARFDSATPPGALHPGRGVWRTPVLLASVLLFTPVLVIVCVLALPYVFYLLPRGPAGAARAFPRGGAVRRDRAGRCARRLDARRRRGRRARLAIESPRGRAAQAQRTRVPPAPPAGQDLGGADQAAHQPARPRACVLAGRRGGVRRDQARPAQAVHYTARANLIAVVTNGTAVLGLGAIGPLAAKPVMEGKSVLFKKFAGIDCFDIEIDERDRRSWSTSSPRSSRPSARSTSRTSRRRCFVVVERAAQAHEDPGVPRRPAPPSPWRPRS